MIVELDAHVFEITMHPDDPGIMRRTIKLELLSGEPLTEREAAMIAARLISDYEQRGGKVHRVTYGE